MIQPKYWSLNSFWALWLLLVAVIMAKRICILYILTDLRFIWTLRSLPFVSTLSSHLYSRNWVEIMRAGLNPAHVHGEIALFWHVADDEWRWILACQTLVPATTTRYTSYCLQLRGWNLWKELNHGNFTYKFVRFFCWWQELFLYWIFFLVFSSCFRWVGQSKNGVHDDVRWKYLLLATPEVMSSGWHTRISTRGGGMNDESLIIGFKKTARNSGKWHFVPILASRLALFWAPLARPETEFSKIAWVWKPKNGISSAERASRSSTYTLVWTRRGRNWEKK